MHHVVQINLSQRQEPRVVGAEDRLHRRVVIIRHAVDQRFRRRVGKEGRCERCGADSVMAKTRARPSVPARPRAWRSGELITFLSISDVAYRPGYRRHCCAGSGAGGGALRLGANAVALPADSPGRARSAAAPAG